MQTLGLTDSAPRTEGRLKSLFWPSIQTGHDVDYLGTQGISAPRGSSTWNPESIEATPPPRLAETWSDKFSDALPMWLWPNVRIPYYVFSIALLMLNVLGLVMILRRRA